MTVTIETPCTLEVLLHCHYSPEPHPRVDTSAVEDSLNFLEANELIEQGEQEMVYRTTALGKWFVKYLCNTPIPHVKTVFVVPDREPES